MNHDQRLEAERQIARDQRLQHVGMARGPAAFHAGEDEFSEDDERLAHRGRLMVAGADPEDFDENDYANLNEFGEARGEIGEWIMKKEVVMYAIRTFQNFLRNFKDSNGSHFYEEVINRMCQNNKCSFELKFVHLSEKHPNLCLWLAEEP